MSGPVPYEELSALARHEAHRKSLHRPPYYLHKWWARRTGTVVRGILLDMLLPRSSDFMSAFYDAHDFTDTIVLDPFMGGGTTLGEALRLGCRVVGCDVNPVAWFLVRRSLQSIDQARADEAFAAVEAEVAKKTLELYRSTCSACGGTATIQNTVWVKQIACGGCGEKVDLNLNQVVMRSFDSAVPHLVDCPECQHVFSSAEIGEEIACPACAFAFTPSEARCANTDYRCRCGHQKPILGESGKIAQPLKHRMRSLTVWCESCGRVHQAPSRADLARYKRVQSDVKKRWHTLMVPRERIPAGRNTDQLRRYGYRYWHQLFNPRQLASLDLLFRAIAKIDDEATRELLLLIASASLEFNSMLCSPKGLGTGAVRQVFTHHAFIPAKTALEANVWGVNSSSGGFSTLYRERVSRAVAWAAQPLEPRPASGGKPQKVAVEGEQLCGELASSYADLESGAANLFVLNHSSEHLDEISDGSVDLIVTDPPYLDMVMYSELSDYFYVWLRLLLKDRYPANFARPLVDDSREAVNNDSRDRDGDFYSELVGEVLREATRKLKPGGRAAFTFHHAGERGWRHIEDAIVRAGLVVERWWPVFAEMESGVPLRGKDNGGHLDIVFVCGRSSEIKRMKRSEPVGELGQRLASKLNLVSADYRALLQATDVQRSTWRRASAAVGVAEVSTAASA